MRLFLLPASLLVLLLNACNKTYTCDCVGLNKAGQHVRYTEDYELARKKDSKTICDSTKRDFAITQPDVASISCELK